MPSVTVGVRWTSDDGRDDLNVVMDAINDGDGATIICNGSGYLLSQVQRLLAHRFRDLEHSLNNVPNLNNPVASRPSLPAAARRSARNSSPFNAPNAAQCSDPASADLHRGRADVPHLRQLFAEQTEQLHLARRIFRRPQGQRTGVVTRYVDVRELAALVLAADRNASGSGLLSSRSTSPHSTATSMRASTEPELCRHRRPPT